MKYSHACKITNDVMIYTKKLFGEINPFTGSEIKAVNLDMAYTKIKSNPLMVEVFMKVVISQG